MGEERQGLKSHESSEHSFWGEEESEADQERNGGADEVEVGEVEKRVEEGGGFDAHDEGRKPVKSVCLFEEANGF